MTRTSKSTAQEVAYTRTPFGQLLYDLAFVDLSDKWLARKHKLPIAEIRKLKAIKSVAKLRNQRKKERNR